MELRMKRHLALTLAIVILLFSVAGTVFAGPETTPTPTETAPESIITLAEDGRTITLQAGERFLLKLGEGYDWNITIDDQTVLSRVVNELVVRGAQGIYVAHKPGRAALTAIGDPVCRSAKPPCMAPSRLFRLDVVVAGAATTPKTSAFEVFFAIVALLAVIMVRRR